MKSLQWIVTAAASWFACHFAVHHATPVDRALPFIAVIVVLVAMCTREAVLLAVPALMLAELTLVDETARLIAFGLILAVVISIAVLRSPLCAAVAAIVLLRWIPFDDVLVFRELFLLVIAVAIVLVLGRTPFAACAGVLAALITPAVPLRTLALPLAVLLAAALARLFGMPRLRLAWPSALVVAFALTFFAWSGVVARAFPYFLRDAKKPGERYTVNFALPASHGVTIPVPQNACALIVSGANVPQLRRGALLGRIEPGGIDVRIGDAADWGATRREQAYGARNPLPRDPAGKIRGYGYLAWIDGAGRVPLPRGAKAIRVTAAPQLPANASLQIEAFELAPR